MAEPKIKVEVDPDTGEIGVEQMVFLPSPRFPERLVIWVPKPLGMFLMRWASLAVLPVALFQAADVVLWHWQLLAVSALWAGLMVAMSFGFVVALAHISAEARRLDAEIAQFRGMMAANVMANISEAVRAGIEGRAPRPVEPTTH